MTALRRGLRPRAGACSSPICVATGRPGFSPPRRRDRVSRRRSAATFPISSMRSARTRGRGRLRLGRARRLHRRGVMAGARRGVGHDRRLQHPEYCRATKPGAPAAEYRYWYQWYFHTERGRAGLAANRVPLCRLLWELWSPNYRFDDATYQTDCSILRQSGFCRGGDPILPSSLRCRPGRSGTRGNRGELARQPPITVPTISLYGECDGVSPPAAPSATPGTSPAPIRAASSRSPATSCRARPPRR